MRAAISSHLHSILDQSEQLHRQLVYVQDVTKDHLHILQQHNTGRSLRGWKGRLVRAAGLWLVDGLISLFNVIICELNNVTEVLCKIGDWYFLRVSLNMCSACLKTYCLVFHVFVHVILCLHAQKN